MKIAIFSDSHDNLPNIDEALNIIATENITTIIHCGDVCMPETLRHLAKHFSGTIHLTNGNSDDEHNLEQTKLPNVIFYGSVGSLPVDGKTMGWTHYPQTARELANSGAYDIIFHGHTHQPGEGTVGEIKIVNPGTLGGGFARPTFALYDTATDTLELKILYQKRDLRLKI
ncbi:YfcE family phosphodiesterase [Candidatus Falkowbacteria bacterium]|nr:YfcE family phosphodiesterase [Candidatus Falkowbacteria bacterium]